MATPAIDTLPGFRRRLVITPGSGWVRSDVEDDYHWMSVTVRHEGGIATAVEPAMPRHPWATCPGAVAELKRTFTNVPLNAFVRRGEKETNCTHLHDLAVLAAVHATDAEPLVYDILISDPVDGKRRSELRRNGKMVMSWAFTESRFTEPAELLGVTLYEMRSWIGTLDPMRQEAARLLRWTTMIAHGRQMTDEQMLEAGKRPQSACYTFQPHMAPGTRRVGEVRDFSRGGAQPLDHREAALATGY